MLLLVYVEDAEVIFFILSDKSHSLQHIYQSYKYLFLKYQLSTNLINSLHV